MRHKTGDSDDCVRETTDRCFSLTLMSLPLSPSLPLFPKINKHILG